MTPHLLARPRRGWPLVALWLALIAATDWLYYRAPLGANLALGAALLLAVALLRAPQRAQAPAGRVLVAALLGLLALLLLDPGPLPVLLAVLGLGALAHGSRGPLVEQAWELLHAGVEAPVKLLNDLPLLHRWLRWRGRGTVGQPQPAGGVGGWGVPVLLAGVFVALFSLANPVLAQWLQAGGHALRAWCASLVTLPPLARVVLWALAGLALWGWLRLRHRRRPLPAALLTAPAPTPSAAFAALLLRCLLLLNLVFALENALDLRYLWGGAALPAGITAAAYAHRGAYPLVAAALLAAVLVLLAFRTAADTTAWRWAQRLVVLWLAQTVALTLAAIWRLWCYVDLYTLTRWRLAAAIWMGLVAIGLVWIIVRIVCARDHRWLVTVNAATLLVVLYACCAVNFPGLIATYNVRHCRELRGGDGPPLDLDYLAELGPAALPAVATAIRAILAPPDQAAALQALQTQLAAQLHDQLADWRGWTLRRAQLAAVFPTPPPHP